MVIGGSAAESIAQTFTAGLSGILAGINLDVRRNTISNPGIFTLHIAIHTTENDNPTSTVLGETSISSGEAPFTQLITFPQKIYVASGVKYAIVVNYEEPLPPTGYVGMLIGSSNNDYTKGEFLYSLDGTSWVISEDDDINFRTYVSISSLDATSPVTSALLIPLPDAYGWNSSNVTVNLAAADEAGGSGVKEIHYAINGGTETVVSGNSTSFIVSNSGVNLITYFTVDNAGNVETPKSVTVKICDYSFEDSMRGTKLYVVERDKTFQFVTRDKTYPIKTAPFMKINDLSKDTSPQFDKFSKKWKINDGKFDLDSSLRPWFGQFWYNNRPDKIILINYKDAELQLSAVIVDGKEDSCVLFAKDLKTKKIYQLIDKPKINWRWGNK